MSEIPKRYRAAAQDIELPWFAVTRPDGVTEMVAAQNWIAAAGLVVARAGSSAGWGGPLRRVFTAPLGDGRVRLTEIERGWSMVIEPCRPLDPEDEPTEIVPRPD